MLIIIHITSSTPTDMYISFKLMKITLNAEVIMISYHNEK